MNNISKVVAFVFAVATSILGYRINAAAGSHAPLFWSIVDFFFSLLAWAKWLIFQQVNISIIKHTFSWFFQ